MKKTFNIKTLGCKVNSYESEFIRSLFLKNGFEEVEEDASVFIVNTCTVTNNSDKKSKKIINSIRKNYPKSILIVVGCYVQYLNDKANELIDADIILGNQDKSKLFEYLNDYIKNNNNINAIKAISNQFEDMEISETKFHARAFVKIQDGCNNFCSYCIIPYVRGRVRSKLKVNVIKEINLLVKNKVKEIVLTGIHIGQYGNDFKDYNLSKLIEEIFKINELKRLRLSSIEVVEITNDLLSILKNNNNFASHLHIPLQSGNDKILKLMNRRYDTNYYKEKVNAIRNIRPDISITTDVIVGFPGETEEDFNETYNFCKDINFSKIHVFPYSDRNGTAASKLKDKVSDVIKKERVKKLIKLSETLERNYYNLFIGKSVEILIEEKKNEFYYGHTSNYLYLKLKGNYTVNELYKVTLE